MTKAQWRAKRGGAWVRYADHPMWVSAPINVFSDKFCRIGLGKLAGVCSPEPGPENYNKANVGPLS
jgi:hypothetical protein